MSGLELFLLSVGVVSGLTTLLALVAVVADATIGNYGEVTITVNGERTLRVRGGRPLLALLKEEGIFIPSACGGRGSCGLCKVRTTAGGGDILPTEEPWLSPDERRQRVRLGCQCKVKGDLAIEIPEELFRVRQFEARVESIRDLTHDIKEVTLRLVEPPAIEFKAGQFIQFEVPEYELTAERVYRAYSISSPPARRDIVELEIRLVPHGICTTYVHQHLKAGDPVTLNGPYGDFYLRDGDAELIFIAGGSGMAPVKSILLDMAARGDARRARYFFGARSARDLFLVEEMRALEARLPRFSFIPVLSQPLDGDGWTGERGLVTEVVGRHVAAGTRARAYLCGSPGMIDASIAALKAKGLTDAEIFYDKFA